ncbi:hypothetical protein O185_23315 [Photorhabdus temperata J3]|uniref:Uncharacterized protein n=1 Tax=Photorhabdus temperata J3 TaxID=1389415 RepID=U7QS67_PHOTE|nr:hypothetical protein O185_23315 [Photorhabdus temperata J3]
MKYQQNRLEIHIIEDFKLLGIELDLKKQKDIAFNKKIFS